MNCPLCSGEMWDNRAKKAAGTYKPGAPAFACRDKDCKGRIWDDPPPARAKMPPPPTPVPAATKPAATGAPAKVAPVDVLDWGLLALHYQKATAAVVVGLTRALGCQANDLDQQAVQAGAATLLIRSDLGMYRKAAPPPPPAPKPRVVPPAPRPVPPESSDDFETFPATLGPDSDDLPF